MKKVIQIKRSVKRVVRTVAGDASTGGRPKRVVITTSRTSKRQSYR